MVIQGNAAGWPSGPTAEITISPKKHANRGHHIAPSSSFLLSLILLRPPQEKRKETAKGGALKLVVWIGAQIGVFPFNLNIQGSKIPTKPNREIQRSCQKKDDPPLRHLLLKSPGGKNFHFRELLPHHGKISKWQEMESKRTPHEAKRLAFHLPEQHISRCSKRFLLSLLGAGRSRGSFFLLGASAEPRGKAPS